MHVNTHIGQMKHHNVSVEKQFRNCSHTTVSILAAWRCNPGIVIGASLDLSDTRVHMTQTMNISRLEMEITNMITLICDTEDVT